MPDLLVIIPTRGRPDRVVAALDAALSLSETDARAVVAYDDDDPAAPGYAALAEECAGGLVSWAHGPRDTLCGWTNRLALEGLGEYRAFFSMGDDHLPRTPGWDRLLLEAIDGMGGTGFAYGDDLGQGERLATSVMVSADIVKALGYLMLPTCEHFHVDDAWMTLGREGGCLAWCPHVVIEHAHPAWGKAEMDSTYAVEAPKGGRDQAAWNEWWHGPGRLEDVAKVAALVSAKAVS